MCLWVLWQVDDDGTSTNLSELWAAQGRFVGPIDDFDNHGAFGLSATWIQSGNDICYSSGGPFSSSLTAGFSGPISNLEMLDHDPARFTVTTVVPLPCAAWPGFGLLGAARRIRKRR